MKIDQVAESLQAADARVGGRRGCEVLAMAANALSFVVGIVLPLGGALWLVLH